MDWPGASRARGGQDRLGHSQHQKPRHGVKGTLDSSWRLPGSAGTADRAEGEDSELSSEFPQVPPRPLQPISGCQVSTGISGPCDAGS